MTNEILKFKEKYPIEWEKKILIAKNAIYIKDDIQYIKTVLIGFIYRGIKLLPERLYGTKEEINNRFFQISKDLKGLSLEISACPVEFDKWSKAIMEFKDEQYKDKIQGIDTKSLEELEKEMPF